MGKPSIVPVAGQDSRMRALEVRMRSRQLAKLLGVDPASFGGRELPALFIMAALAMMPTVTDHDKRRAFGNEILANADQLLPSADPANGAFWSYLRPLVIEMQEFRYWFRLFSSSPAELIRSYWWLDKEVGILGWLGVGGLASPSGGIVKGAVAAGQKAWPQGMRTAALASARGAGTGAVRTVTGGMTGRLAVFWAIGSFVYWQGKAYRDAMRRELQCRYQEGKLTPEQYEKALGSDEPLPAPYLYELRR